MALFRKKQDVAGKIGQPSPPFSEPDPQDVWHDNSSNAHPLSARGDGGKVQYDPITHAEIRNAPDGRNVRGALQRSIYEPPQAPPPPPATKQPHPAHEMERYNRSDMQNGNRRLDDHRVQFREDQSYNAPPNYQIPQQGNDYNRGNLQIQIPSSYPNTQHTQPVVTQPIVMPIGVTIPAAPQPQQPPPMYPMPMPYMYPPGMMPGMFNPFMGQMPMMNGFPQMMQQQQQGNQQQNADLRSSKDGTTTTPKSGKDYNIIANEEGSDALNRQRKLESRKNHLDYLQDLEKQIEEQRQKKEREKKEQEALDMKAEMEANQWNSRPSPRHVPGKPGRNQKGQGTDRVVGPGGGLLIPKESIAETHTNDPGNPFSSQPGDHTVYSRMRAKMISMAPGQNNGYPETNPPVNEPVPQAELRYSQTSLPVPPPPPPQQTQVIQPIMQVPDHITAELARLTKENSEQKTKYEAELLKLQEDFQRKIDELHKQQTQFLEQQAKLLDKSKETPKDPYKTGIENILSIQKENLFLEREQQLMKENISNQEEMILRLRMETEIAKMHGDAAQSELMRVKGVIKERELQERLGHPGLGYRQRAARDRPRRNVSLQESEPETRNPVRQMRRENRSASVGSIRPPDESEPEKKAVSIRQQMRALRNGRADDNESMVGESCFVYQNGQVDPHSGHKEAALESHGQHSGRRSTRPASTSSIETIPMPPSRESRRARYGRRAEHELKDERNEGGSALQQDYPSQQPEKYDVIHQRNIERLAKLESIDRKGDEDNKLQMVDNFLKIKSEKIPTAYVRPQSAGEESLVGQSQFLDH